MEGEKEGGRERESQPPQGFKYSHYCPLSSCSLKNYETHPHFDLYYLIHCDKGDPHILLNEQVLGNFHGDLSPRKKLRAVTSLVDNWLVGCGWREHCPSNREMATVSQHLLGNHFSAAMDKMLWEVRIKGRTSVPLELVSKRESRNL